MPVELILALFVLALLGVGLRLAFGTGDRNREPDYGLLRPIAVAPSERAADAVTARLRAHSIRVTTVPVEDAIRVLVFPADEQRAISVLLEEEWPEVG